MGRVSKLWNAGLGYSGGKGDVKVVRVRHGFGGMGLAKGIAKEIEHWTGKGFTLTGQTESGGFTTLTFTRRG